mgnify:CR=1 FL=1
MAFRVKGFMFVGSSFVLVRGSFSLCSSCVVGVAVGAVIVKVPEPKAHNHYFKSVEGLDYIDVYRVLQLFSVIDPCIQHAIKKLLVAGGRGAGKSIEKDIQEAIDSLKRWQEMQTEAK